MEENVGNIKNVNLLILDDIYPHPNSLDSWRGIEISAYLDNFPNSTIYSTMSSISLLGNYTKEEIISRFYKMKPSYISRFVYEEKEACIKKADFVYSIFLNNIWENLEHIEKYGIPFAFELYPGGGFALDNEESDEKLRRVLCSDFFSGVIVTNIVTYNYLISKNYCLRNKVSLIAGCVLNNQVWQEQYILKKNFGFEKENFDIAFVAYKYSKYGIDKGYDIFVKVAKELHKISNKFHFHVVGNFNEEVLEVNDLAGFIHFYGIQNAKWFNDFYQDIDVLLSPNKAFVLNEGAFDGFPTGCGIDAIIRKTVLIASDELNQNTLGQYQNGTDLYIVLNDPRLIIDRILFLYRYPHVLKKMSYLGFEKAKTIYSDAMQLKTRISFLGNCMRSNILQRGD